MKRVKITVLKTMLNEDLAKEYGICGLKACPMMKVGDVFYADYAKPNGLCDEAWKTIYLYVFALAHGADKELFALSESVEPAVITPLGYAADQLKEKNRNPIEEITEQREQSDARINTVES